MRDKMAKMIFFLVAMLIRGTRMKEDAIGIKMELALILDESGSIKSSDFQRVAAVVRELPDHIAVSEDGIREAVFGTDEHVAVDLSESKQLAALYDHCVVVTMIVAIVAFVRSQISKVEQVLLIAMVFLHVVTPGTAAGAKTLVEGTGKDALKTVTKHPVGAGIVLIIVGLICCCWKLKNTLQEPEATAVAPEAVQAPDAVQAPEAVQAPAIQAAEPTAPQPTKERVDVSKKKSKKPKSKKSTKTTTSEKNHEKPKKKKKRKKTTTSEANDKKPKKKKKRKKTTTKSQRNNDANDEKPKKKSKSPKKKN